MMYKEEIQLLYYYKTGILLNIVKPEDATNKAPLSQIKIIAFKEKGEWNLQAKYNIGKKVVKEEEKKLNRRKYIMIRLYRLTTGEDIIVEEGIHYKKVRSC